MSLILKQRKQILTSLKSLLNQVFLLPRLQSHHLTTSRGQVRAEYEVGSTEHESREDKQNYEFVDYPFMENFVLMIIITARINGMLIQSSSMSHR